MPLKYSKRIKTAAYEYAKGERKYLQGPRKWVKGYITHTQKQIYSIFNRGDFLSLGRSGNSQICSNFPCHRIYAKIATVSLDIPSTHHVPLCNYFWAIFNRFSMISVWFRNFMRYNFSPISVFVFFGAVDCMAEHTRMKVWKISVTSIINYHFQFDVLPWLIRILYSVC